MIFRTQRPRSGQPELAAGAAFIGTTLEWYDFYIYATASALIFGKLFFPSHDPFLSTLASFGTIAVGFFSRPFGGLVFGHLGDKIGRKKVLLATLVIMAISTIGIGFLPTFGRIGILAPLILILLRVAQGIAVGGEWGGAVLLAAEHAPVHRRTFLASFAQLGSPAGLILSLVAFRLVTSMPSADFLNWGWRIPFFASALLLVIGVAIRLGVHESPAFEEIKEQKRTVKLPVLDVVRDEWRTVLLCMGANVIGVAGAGFVNSLMLNYTTQTLHFDRAMVLGCLSIVAVIQLGTQLAAGWLADRVGAARFLKSAAILAMFSPYPMFVLVQTGRPLAIIAGFAIAVICMSSSYAVMAGFMTNVFPVHVRYSAISLSYQLCAALAGGLTPLIGTVLVYQYAGEWWPLAVFYSILSLTTLLCVARLSQRLVLRTGSKDIPPANQQP